MNPPHLKKRMYNQHKAWRFHHIEPITHAIQRYFKSLSSQNMHQLLITFYQDYIYSTEAPFEVLLFKKNFDDLRNERQEILFHKMQQKMTSYFLNEHHDSTNNDLHLSIKSQSVDQSFYDYIEKDFNQSIINTILFVYKWQHAFSRLKPAAFIIEDQSEQKIYQEVCFNHDLLCLSKTQYHDIKHKKKQSLKEIYEQYIKREMKRHRDVHIWCYHQNYIKHLQQEEVIPILTYDALTKIHDQSQKQDLFILPIPEDLVELERWSYTYLKTNQYILWLKNDALLTHYKSVPKHVEVVIDLNVIYQEILDINPLESFSFHVFQHEVVPLIREIHQTLRIKKIKHYLYGYALSQNDILHRCLTLGFRHLIIHQPHLYKAIEESVKFMNYTHR